MQLQTFKKNICLGKSLNYFDIKERISESPISQAWVEDGVTVEDRRCF